MKSSLERLALNLCYTVVVLALAIMLTLVFGNVVLRYAFDSGIAAAEELARISFIWCTFVGAVIALQQNAHIGIAGVRPFLPPGLRRFIDVVAIAILVVVSVIMLIGSIEFLVGNLGGKTPILEIPMAVAFTALIVSALGMTLVFMARLWSAATVLVARRR